MACSPGRAALAESDLSLPQFRVLHLLADGIALPSSMADTLDVRRPSITAVVDGLVARALVVREHDAEDRRRVTHSITKEGRHVLEAADRAVEERLCSIAGTLRGRGPSGESHRRVGPLGARTHRVAQPEATTAGDLVSPRPSRVREHTLKTDPFVPIAEASRYAPPRATIDADSAKSWLRRAMPIVKAHRASFLTALGLSFLGLIFQVQIPNLLNKAINNSIVHHTVPIHFYVEWILGLGIAGGLAGYISRLAIYRTAYAIEFDLRNIIYEHLTRMSFSFYDKVQSGQLISRANSDIRSVQMYMTFAPLILLQCAIVFVAFGFMLSISVPLAFIAMVTMPFVYLVGVQMRKSMFPVSWLIQSRLAEVATIVDENVNGVRVVKSFAAEDQQLKDLAQAATGVQWAYVKDADLRARFTPAVQNLPQVGLVLVLLFGGWMVIDGHLGIGAIVAFNSYLLMMQVPFMMLGMLIMMSQRAAASAERIYEILDERSEIVDRPGAIDLLDCKGDVHFDRVDFGYPGGDRPLRAREASTSASAPARPLRSSAGPVRGSRRWRDCSHVSTT